MAVQRGKAAAVMECACHSEQLLLFFLDSAHWFVVKLEVFIIFVPDKESDPDLQALVARSWARCMLNPLPNRLELEAW